MSLPEGLSPHRCPVDLEPLRGATVLGEPLDVLVSFLLRIQLGAPRAGTVPLAVTCTTEEGSALERAMARAEREVPGDCRTPGGRDVDRLLIVAERVMETAAAVSTAVARAS